MITTATLKDLTRIMEIKEKAVRHMHDLGIMQWNDVYPNAAIFKADIQRGDLYVLRNEEGLIIGLACINQIHAPEYHTLSWKTSSNAYTVHRLVVDPDAHGKGYGQTLLKYAETLALKAGISGIRIDTFSENFITQKLFKKLGYTDVGSVYFDRVSKPFYCYEKILD